MHSMIVHVVSVAFAGRAPVVRFPRLRGTMSRRWVGWLVFVFVVARSGIAGATISTTPTPINFTAPVTAPATPTTFTATLDTDQSPKEVLLTVDKGIEPGC